MADLHFGEIRFAFVVEEAYYTYWCVCVCERDLKF